jgi:hypothetical protein
MDDAVKKIPVLFVIFNRPAVAVEAFQSIKRYQPERLYLAADGPRPEKEGEAELCRETRELILKEIDWECEVKKLFRAGNVGCGRGVSEGITWMFETEEYGAIIEDDCVVSDDYFRFCEELLPEYKYDDRVAQINCFRKDNIPEYADTWYFTGYPENLGWATWRRAWNNFDFEMKQWKRIHGKTFTRFSFWEACLHYYLWNKVYRVFQQGKKPDAWDYQWSIYIFLNKKLCIEPHVNLVRNIGFDATSTHCTDTENPIAKAVYGKMTFPLARPGAVQWDTKRERKRSHDYGKYYGVLLWRKLQKIFRQISL